MKFSGKMCFKIILKVTKNQGFTLSSEDTFFRKPQEGGRRDKLIPPPPAAILGLTTWIMSAVNVEDRLNSYVAYLTCKFSRSIVQLCTYLYYDTIKVR